MAPGSGIAHIVTCEAAADFEASTLHAAALCCCGVPVRTFKTPRERTGEIEWRFDYAPAHPIAARGASASAMVRIHGNDVPSASLTANQLMHVFRSGLLERVDPAHPFLTAVRALRNRERLLRWIMAGQTAQLVRHPHCDQWQYESAPLAEIPSTMAAQVWTTKELKIACALGVFGIPIIRCSGLLPDMTFELAFTGFPGAVTAPHTCQLANDFRSGALDAKDPDHPFFIAYSAIATLQKIKRHMQAEIANVWIEKPRSRIGTSAFIRADATAKARDTVFHHFRRCDG